MGRIESRDTFNKYQTELTEELKKKYPEEVIDEF